MLAPGAARNNVLNAGGAWCCKKRPFAARCALFNKLYRLAGNSWAMRQVGACCAPMELGGGAAAAGYALHLAGAQLLAAILINSALASNLHGSATVCEAAWGQPSGGLCRGRCGMAGSAMAGQQ
jgi:hypothetical protein